MRWYRDGSYRDALDYFNRPDDRRRADVTDGGNTLVIYKVRFRFRLRFENRMDNSTTFFQVLPEDKGTYYCEVEGGRNYGGGYRTQVRFYPRQPNVDSICR